MRLTERPLEELTAEARAVRDAQRGRLVTYSPKVFIPLTKLCRDVCHYCTFAAAAPAGERAYLTIDEVLEIARAGERAGCREALFTLGRQAGAALPAPPARSSPALGLRLDARVPRRRRARRARGDLAAAAPQPGRARRGRLRAAAPGRGLDGDDARDELRQRLSQRGGPHFGSPDKLPAARLETLRLAGEARVPFTTGILIGIGETRAERVEALEAIAAAGPARAGGDRPELPRQARHADGARARAAARGAPLDDRGRPADPAARGRAPGAAEPDRRLRPAARRRHRRLGRRLAASRSTTSTPRRRGPSSSCLRAATESRGLELVAAPDRLPRAHRRRRGSTRACCRASCAPPTRSASPARTTGPPARPASVPFVVRRDPLPLELARRARRGRDRAAVPGARRGAPARVRRGRPAAARGERRRRQLRRDPERPVHERLLLPLRLLRLLEGEAGREPARRAVPRAARRRSCGARSRRGSAARPRSASRAGSIPRFDGDYYVSVVRAIKDAVPGPARPRLQRARGLAGRRDARRAAAPTTWRGCATRGSPRCRERPPRCSTTRCARSSAPTRSRPRSGSRCTRPRTRSASARTTRSCSATSTGRGTGRATCSRCASSSSATGGFTEFVPLPFVHMEAPIYLKGRARAGADLRRGAADARRRPARAPPVDRERAGLVGQGRAAGRRRGAARRGERPRRHADERVDLARRRRRVGPGARARADGGADPLGGPRAAAADDALRRAAGGAGGALLRRRAARRSRGTRTSTRRGSSGRASSSGPS